MIYGYARCSTNESKQDINRQVRELKAAGAEKVFLEYEHGDAAYKKEQSMLFDTIAEGDRDFAISKGGYIFAKNKALPVIPTR